MSDIVPIRTTVDFKAFNIPNFARIEDGQGNALCVPVVNLEPNALDELAGFWLHQLYKKCGREMPWEISANIAEGK